MLIVNLSFQTKSKKANSLPFILAVPNDADAGEVQKRYDEAFSLCFEILSAIIIYS